VAAFNLSENGAAVRFRVGGRRDVEEEKGYESEAATHPFDLYNKDIISYELENNVES
jgi:hypothetical protein